MAKSFDMNDRYYQDAYGRKPAQRSKGTGGGSSPLDPMGADVPGYSACGGQSPSNNPRPECDRAPLGHSTAGDKKSTGLAGR